MQMTASDRRWLDELVRRTEYAARVAARRATAKLMGWKYRPYKETDLGRMDTRSLPFDRFPANENDPFEPLV